MKKVLRYMKDQAAHPSPTLAYLAPPGLEPQQRAHHRKHHEAQHHRDYHTQNHYPSSAAHTTPSHVSGSGVNSGVSFETERHQYAQDNILQSYDLYIPEHAHGEESSGSAGDYWIIYIHGGAYRDPSITASSFHRTLSMLLQSPLYTHAALQIAGIASLNYRLSAHPDHPQDPSKTSDYELRNAKHPDHVDDILTAIGVLQQKYGFGQRYLLVGHSVGATLAFQVALNQTVPWTSPSKSTSDSNPNPKVEPPLGVLGVEGIYSFPDLLKSFSHVPLYETFTRGALGDDKRIWDEVSPANWSKETYTSNWGMGTGKRRLASVAHSRADELVDWAQVEAIRGVFEKGGQGWEGGEFRVIELKGTHHEIWEKGAELARPIAEAVKALEMLEHAEP